MAWEEDGSERRGGPLEPRVLGLDLSRLDGGRYELEVSVEARGETVRACRWIEVGS